MLYILSVATLRNEVGRWTRDGRRRASGGGTDLGGRFSFARRAAGFFHRCFPGPDGTSVRALGPGNHIRHLDNDRQGAVKAALTFFPGTSSQPSFFFCSAIQREGARAVKNDERTTSVVH